MNRTLKIIDLCMRFVAFVFLTVYVVNGNAICHFIWWIVFGIHIVLECFILAFEHRKKK